MSTLNYKQYGLAPFFDSLSLEQSARSVVYKVTLAVREDKVVLSCRDADTGKDYIEITEDCFVTVQLDGDQLFFSDAYEAITTKEELSSYYGGLVYADYDKAYGRYKTVQFKARFNAGGKYGTIHPFNINVDLLQEDAKGNRRWTGISIDPDITNPPPIDG
ncbi:MAG: nucleotide synthetase [Pseudomonadota bacterium]|nr:nucleotide synthetase [Pseudomonadota bacterium]